MTFCKGMCGRLYNRIRSTHSNYKYGPMCKTCQIRVETHDIVCRCCHTRFRLGNRSDRITQSDTPPLSRSITRTIWAEDSEELFRFGHIASPEERQLLADEKAGKLVSRQQRIAANRPYL